MTEENKTVLPIDTALVKQTLSDLFAKLEIAGTCDVTLSEAGAIDVILDTPDSGLVIGYHGEVLESLQLISSLVVSKQIGQFVRVSIEVGDYKKNRSEYLERLAQQTKEKVLAEQQEYSLPQLKSWERRIVHMLLQNDDAVVSESVGEGKDRVLVIKPR